MFHKFNSERLPWYASRMSKGANGPEHAARLAEFQSSQTSFITNRPSRMLTLKSQHVATKNIEEMKGYLVAGRIAVS